MKYSFADFTIDTAKREVRRGDKLVSIEPRTYELLAYLAEHRERAVGKDELQEKVWGTIVTDSALTRTVMKLRKALDDKGESIIKTVPRFGYRFVAELETPSVEAAPASVAEQHAQPRKPLIIGIALAALIIGLVFVMRAYVFTEAVAEKSIAVLPFDDLSEAQDQRWFADGLAEEILNSLARTPDLRVAARTSSFALRDSRSDVRTIADSLGVAHILEGSVRRDAGQIRVTAQLIRASDGFHLWSQNYDHPAEDLIQVQESIAISIANALETAMDPEALAAFVSSGTRSVPAFEAYLEGLAGYAQMIETGDVDAYISSIEAFERAVELDPEFGLAYSQIANYWITQLSAVAIASQRRDRPLEEVRQLSRQALDAALAHTDDPTRHLGLRVTEAIAEVRLRQALQLNTEFLAARPLDKEAQGRQLNLLAQLNRYDDVVTTALEFLDRDGFDPVVSGRSVHLMSYSGDKDALRRVVDRIEGNLDFNVITMYQVHRALLWLGDVERAADLFERLLASELSPAFKAYARLRQLCAEGRVEEAEAVYVDAKAAFGHRSSFGWMSSQIMGYPGRGLEPLYEFDADNNLNALAGFLYYGSFDPGPFPNLMQHLEMHGNETGYLVEVPFRCHKEEGVAAR